MDNAWEEMHSGSDITLPGIYKFIIKFITPVFLLFILGFWTFQRAIPVLLLKNVEKSNIPFILLTRFILLALFVTFCILVKIAWEKKGEKIES